MKITNIVIIATLICGCLDTPDEKQTFPEITSFSSAPIEPAYQTIKMNVTASSFQPNHFTLKKGIPVKWIIDGSKASGCTKSIRAPKYNIAADVAGKTQTIEFTPSDAGNFEFTCWMGMVRGSFLIQ